MKLLIIYNNNAGGGKAKKLFPQIESYLQEKGIDAEFLFTEYSGHAVELVELEKLNTYNGIIASGGDGTLYEVLNGYYNNKGEAKPPIGVIPNGTGNAFSKDLGLLAGDWKKAIDNIVAKNIKYIDVARYKANGGTRHFINIVGTCFVADIAKRAIFWKFLGNAAYTLAVLLEAINLKSTKTQIIIDGKKLERDCTFVEVANSRYTGTTFIMAPNAKLDDGKLDVIIVNKLSRLRLFKILNTIYDGSHIHEKEVETYTAENISIITETPKTLVPDGEIMGETPIDVTCLKHDLAFYWPPENK